MHLSTYFSLSPMKCAVAFVPLQTIFLDFAHFLSALQRYSSKIANRSKQL